MKTAQWLVVAFVVASFLRNLWTDMYGVKEHEPRGFSGVIISLIVFVLITWLYYVAGAFSLIWR